VKYCGENQNTHFVTKNVSSENRDDEETMWKNIVAYCKLWLGAEELLIKDQRLPNFSILLTVHPCIIW